MLQCHRDLTKNFISPEQRKVSRMDLSANRVESRTLNWKLNRRQWPCACTPTELIYGKPSGWTWQTCANVSHKHDIPFRVCFAKQQQQQKNTHMRSVQTFSHDVEWCDRIEFCVRIPLYVLDAHFQFKLHSASPDFFPVSFWFCFYYRVDDHCKSRSRRSAKKKKKKKQKEKIINVKFNERKIDCWHDSVFYKNAFINFSILFFFSSFLVSRAQIFIVWCWAIRNTASRWTLWQRVSCRRCYRKQ